MDRNFSLVVPIFLCGLISTVVADTSENQRVASDIQNLKANAGRDKSSEETYNLKGLPTDITGLQMSALKSLLFYSGYYSPSTDGASGSDYYLNKLETIMRICNFFVRPLSPIHQAMFAIKIGNIIWKAANMYNKGKSVGRIAMSVTSDIIYVAALGRRGIQNTVADTSMQEEMFNMNAMDVPTFLSYIHSIKYPYLTREEEEFIQLEVTKAVKSTFFDQSSEEDKKQELIHALTDTVKFMTFYDEEGRLKVPLDQIDKNIFEKFMDKIKSYYSYEGFQQAITNHLIAARQLAQTIKNRLFASVD